MRTRMDLITMSTRELDRLEVMRRVQEKRLTRVKAGALLGLSARQARRLFKQFERLGPQALVSRKRGARGNRQLPAGVKEKAIALVRERYLDFGPTLAREKLAELHDVRVSGETLRKWMTEAGIWKNRAARKAAPHQPRNRRECFGELVQIDGCNHHWFEERGPACSLLVYDDDATGKLMVTVQAPVESAGSAWHSARVQTKIEHLSRRIEVVVEEHLEACRLEAEAALKRAFGVSPRKAVRGGDRARSAKAENRRNSSELAMLRERLLQAVAAKPGETMTVLAVEAGSSARDLKFPMRQLKQARQVRSAGERGSTRYFPMVLPKSA